MLFLDIGLVKNTVDICQRYTRIDRLYGNGVDEVGRSVTKITSRNSSGGTLIVPYFFVKTPHHPCWSKFVMFAASSDLFSRFLYKMDNESSQQTTKLRS